MPTSLHFLSGTLNDETPLDFSFQCWALLVKELLVESEVIRPISSREGSLEDSLRFKNIASHKSYSTFQFNLNSNKQWYCIVLYANKVLNSMYTRNSFKELRDKLIQKRVHICINPVKTPRQELYVCVCFIKIGFMLNQRKHWNSKKSRTETAESFFIQFPYCVTHSTLFLISRIYIIKTYILIDVISIRREDSQHAVVYFFKHI